MGSGDTKHFHPVLILLLKTLKLIAVGALFAGTIGAVFARDFTDRQRFAYQLAGPGFGAVWLLGFGLAFSMGLSLLSLWTVGAMVLSVFSLNVVLYVAGKDGRGGWVSGTLAVGSLALTVGLMVFKPT